MGFLTVLPSFTHPSGEWEEQEACQTAPPPLIQVIFSELARSQQVLAFGVLTARSETPTRTRIAHAPIGYVRQNEVISILRGVEAGLVVNGAYSAACLEEREDEQQAQQRVWCGSQQLKGSHPKHGLG